MTRVRLALLGGALVVLLGLLLTGLEGTEFRGPREEREVGIPPLRVERPPFLFPEWVLNALLIFILSVVAISLALAIFVPEARRLALRGLVALLLLAGLGYALRTRVQPLTEEVVYENEGGGAPVFATPQTEGEARPEALPPELPPWLAYVVAGIGGGLVAWWAVRRFRPAPSPPPAAAIEEAVGAARDDLARGLPLYDVVIRCWLRMVEIVSPYLKKSELPTLTPRELAARLVAFGFRPEGVEVLTRLFEEVRYGHKESEPRREAAVAALAAVERVS